MTPSQAPPPRPIGDPPPLTRLLKLLFGIGGIGEAMVYTAISQFVLIYYNQIRGDPAELVGLAASAGLFANAVCDPLVGSWSDRTRSRLGRRHPFLLAAILPTALSFYAIFNPPDGLGQTEELIWLALFDVLLFQSVTLFHTPHLALGGELSQSYTERTSVMNYNTFLLFLGDTTSWVLAFALFFRASDAFPNGALDPSRWPTFSIAIPLTVALLFAISSLGTMSRIPHLPQAAIGAARFGAGAFLRDLRHALGNRNYVALLLGALFYALMSGVRTGLWVYTATYYWRLNNDQVSFFAIGSLVGYLTALFTVRRLHGRYDKRWTGVGAVLLNTLAPAVPLTLGLMGLMGPDTPFLAAILIGFGAMGHAPYSVMTTTYNSVIADIADENELRTGERQEGILYSARTFFSRLDQALGSAVAGWVLALIGFPAKAQPGEVAADVLSGLAAAFVLSSVAGLLAAACYASLRTNRASYETTRAALGARRAAVAAEAVPLPSGAAAEPA